MEDKTKKLLHAEIEREFDNLPRIHTLDDREYAIATEGLVKLYDLKIKEQQAEFEREVRLREELLKNEQMAESKKDRWIKLGIDASGILLPLVFYGVWMGRGFKFEETGTFTSTTFRGLFSRFRPK